MKKLAPAVLAALLAAGVAVAVAFSRDMAEAGARTSGRSQLVATRSGQLEYAVAGHGPPLLMIHGTGGGFDQGLGFTQALLARGHQVIAPSRFGYLRSDFPADASSERQADAFVELLDRLGIRSLPVAGGSAGALSAVQFALRHPERCSALVLVVPAANVRGTDPVRMSALQEFLVRQVTQSDFLFWLGLKAGRAQMTGTLLATDPALVAAAPPSEQQRVDRILREILPVSARSRGMLNDAKLAGSPARVDFTKLRVPVLVISAEDDRFGTAATARDIAAAVPGARLVMFPAGGHVWVGHDDALWTEVSRFVSSAAAVSAARLVDPAIAPAVAGQDGWNWQQSAAADLDGDGRPEKVVLTARVEMVRGRPAWDDGQPWQVYVQDAAGRRTTVYAQRLQLGTLTMRVSAARPGEGARIVLLEHLPDRLSLHEVRYRGFGQLAVTTPFRSDVDPRGDTASPRLR